MIMLFLKGILHLWKDECLFKMGHLCRRNVKLFLNLELSIYVLQQIFLFCLFVRFVFSTKHLGLS